MEENKDVKPEVASAKENTSEAKSKNNKNILIAGVIILAVALIAIAIGAIVLSQGSKDIDRTGLEIYEDTDYIFGYDSSLILEDGSFPQFFSIDPQELEEGQLNNNFNLVAQKGDQTDIVDSENCEELANALTQQGLVQSVYQSIEVDSSEATDVNGYESCALKFDATLIEDYGGADVKIEQVYIFGDSQFVIFTSTAENEDFFEISNKSIDTFEFVD